MVVKGAALTCFDLFQDGERCRFFAQESRTSDTQGVPARKVQAAEGKATMNTNADVFKCFSSILTFVFNTHPKLTTASI